MVQDQVQTVSGISPRSCTYDISNKHNQVFAVLQARDNKTNPKHEADMRLIGVVALAFLSGTFVAPSLIRASETPVQGVTGH